MDESNLKDPRSLILNEKYEEVLKRYPYYKAGLKVYINEQLEKDMWRARFAKITAVIHDTSSEDKDANNIEVTASTPEISSAMKSIAATINARTAISNCNKMLKAVK